jgi:formylglycine-generating enzyme required for sulfatase activity
MDPDDDAIDGELAEFRHALLRDPALQDEDWLRLRPERSNALRPLLREIRAALEEAKGLGSRFPVLHLGTRYVVKPARPLVGGTADVYEAHDSVLERSVAIKISRDRSSMQHEAAVMARLEHPGIAPIYDVGESPPRIIMRWIGGDRTLKDALRGARTVGERLALLEPFQRVCETVAFAHSRGWLHLDLKPENVKIGQHGEVVVLDWGFARPGDDATRASGGTIPYMSPEAVAGESVSTRSDVFSLGVMLYELLTGRTPVSSLPYGGYGNWLRETDPPDPTAASSDPMPDDLVALCRRAQARDSRGRPAGAQELVSEIEMWRDRAVTDRTLTSLRSRVDAILLGCAGDRVDAQELEIAKARAVVEQMVEVRGEGAEVRAARSAVERRAELLRRRRRRVIRRQEIRRRNALVIVAVSLSLVVGTLWAWLTDLHERSTRSADAQRAAQLEERRDRLWPLRGAQVPAMLDWLAEARTLLPSRAKHEADLAAIRGEAKPYDSETMSRDHRAHVEALAAARMRLTRMQDLLARSGEVGLDAATMERLRTDQVSWVAEIRRLEEAVSQRNLWEFDDPALQWEEGTRRQLVRRQAEMSDWIRDVERRVRMTRVIEARARDPQDDAAWAKSASSLRANGSLGDLTLARQVGLVPLGPDPHSGFEEFAVLETGSIPPRGSDGVLRVQDDTAIVLVLLPGGRYRRGAQSADPASPNFDPAATAKEGPVHWVRLLPFFLGKFEITQAQWLRMTNRPNPSHAVPAVDARERFTPRTPVESVRWSEARTWLERFALRLPTEAEWEYGCRAGSDTAWEPGNTVSSLAGYANVADRSFQRLERPGNWSTDAQLDDGWRLPAPVGSFQPNRYGLHDMHGNVAEWCWDLYDDYFPFEQENPVGSEFPEDGGLRGVNRVIRGGQWSDPAIAARSSQRYRQGEDFRSSAIGVRAARPLEGAIAGSTR